jgi:hypothetical protein
LPSLLLRRRSSDLSFHSLDPKRTLERGLELELSDAGLLGVMWLADRGPLAAAGRGQISGVRRLPVGAGEDAGELDQVHPPLIGPT